MTAQVPDYVFYLDKKFTLAAISDGELWVPEAESINPEPVCSACWRGYLATYRVHNDVLELHELKLSYGQLSKGKPPPVGGRKPKRADDDETMGFNWTYPEIGMQLDYSGGLLLADGFIQELYVHMGFHPAWKYKHVHELVFENGRLAGAFDRSRQMAEFRQDLKDKPMQPSGDLDRATLTKWIERTFSRKYGR